MFKKDYSNFISIKVDDESNKLLVKIEIVDIESNNGDTYFVLDTGANCSTIGDTVADQFKLEVTSRARVNGKSADVLELPFLKIGDKIDNV